MFLFLALQVEPTRAGDAAASAGVLAFVVVMALVTIGAMWRVVDKAGEPGWSVLIPIYNVVVMLRIAMLPLWWLLLLLIPVVNLLVSVLINVNVARRFGRTAGFGLGLSFLPFIFYPVLAMSNDVPSPVDA